MDKPSSKTLKEVVNMVFYIAKLAKKKDLRRLTASNDHSARLFEILAATRLHLGDDVLMSRAKLTRSQYQKALFRLKQTLFDLLLSLDLERGNYSNYAKRLYKLDQALVRIRISQRLGLAFAAQQEARNFYSEAVALDEWRVALLLLSPLLNWASLSGDRTEYAKRQAERTRLKHLQRAFDEADEAMDHVVSIFSRSAGEHPELRPMLDAAISKLEPSVREFGTFKLTEAMLTLRRMALQVEMDYIEAIAICDEMEKLLATCPIFANSSRQHRNIIAKLLALIESRQHEQAQKIIDASQSLFNEGDQNWFTLQEWQFLLLLRTKEYEAAYRLMNTLRHTEQFETQTPSEKDRWHLYRIFSEIFTGRKVPFEYRLSEEKTGDVTQGLLRLFPSFNKDYTGHYMSAIVLEILIMFERREDYSYLISRIESLKSFKSRKLHAMHALRSKLFIDMMQLLVEHDFQRAPIVRAARPMFRKMMEIKTIDPIQRELAMPYDQLWEAFVERLPEEGWTALSF